MSAPAVLGLNNEHNDETLQNFTAASLVYFGTTLFAQGLKFQAVPFTEVHFDDAFW